MQKISHPILFTPGPVNIPYRVLSAGSQPMIHHRTPELHAILEDVIGKMKALFGTRHDVFLVHATGRGAMEGALRNLFSPGEKMLCICNGRFGQMFAEIAESCDLSVQRTFTDWFAPVAPEELEALLKNDPDIKGVTVVHSDTSTTLMNPIADIGHIVRKQNRLLLVDCISTLGAMEFRMDDWHVDVAVTASQKGLMAPTGISFAAVNQRAWAAVEKATRPGYYTDFKKIKKFYDDKRETPGSTPVSLLASVSASLEMIFEEGLQKVYARHAAVSRAIKHSMQAMGLTLLPEGDVDRSHALTLVKVPDGTNPSLIKALAREKYGIMIASGFSDLKETTFRIGHIGTVTMREALLVVSVLELILYELRVTGKPGKGLMAFYESLSDESNHS